MKILMMLTSHDRLGDTGKKTGFLLSACRTASRSTPGRSRRREVGAVGLPSGSRLLLTGGLVGAVDLPRLLPNAGNLLHREQARQLDVLYGTG
jgi:hypothetical protein